MAGTEETNPKAHAIGDPVVSAALHQLDRKLREQFGSRYVRVILFGSRARGDYQPDSDVDVAVILRGVIADRWKIKQLIIEDTYPVLLETGLYVQSWPIGEGELADPDKASNPDLVRNILREGIPA